MKRIVVCGGSGYIGQALVRRLVARGDAVTILSRGGQGLGFNPIRHTWDPYKLSEWTKTFDGVDTVVNLAGERAVGVRFTEENKRRIYDSRILVTQNVARAVHETTVKPKLLLNMSAIGFYGDHPAPERIDETCGPGDDFLARLCVDWEAASDAVASVGVRIVNPRMGVVFGLGGGALEIMAKPFKLFVGGKLGSGKQGISWIHLDDAVSALMLCIDDEAMPQKVNVCSPSPANNAEVSAAIGKALSRPSWLRAPSTGLKALLGEGAEPVLTGQFAVPAVLTARGFEFRHASMPEAVAASLL
jgi:uncharacterized protein (TIGR01777 family)